MAEQRCEVCGLEIAWCEWRDWDENPQGAWMHVPSSEHAARPSLKRVCSICGHPQHDMMCNRSLWCGSCNCPGEKQAAEWAAIQPNAEAAKERDMQRMVEVDGIKVLDRPKDLSHQYQCCVDAIEKARKDGQPAHIAKWMKAIIERVWAAEAIAENAEEALAQLTKTASAEIAGSGAKIRELGKLNAEGMVLIGKHWDRMAELEFENSKLRETVQGYRDLTRVQDEERRHAIAYNPEAAKESEWRRKAQAAPVDQR